jgi:1-acyl-sn-glycerol-3-phosphate acyltransferase
MTTLRAGFILFVFLAVTLVGLGPQWLFVKFRLPLWRALAHAYHRFTCRLFGIRVAVVGQPLQGGVLITANHTGWLDITILSAVKPVSFVSKSEVADWPLFGTLARLQRTIFIHRKRAQALEDRDTIRKRLEQGDALVLFPEGTSSDGNRVLPFRSALLSAAELPLAHNARGTVHPPVQPVSVAYVGLHGIPMGRETRPLFAWYGDMELVPHLWEALKTGPIDVTVEFHKPLTIDEAGGRKALAAACEAAVRAGLVRALSGSDAGAAAPQQDEALREALEDAETEEAA